MITLYTAVGRYELRKNENGEKQPIVTVDQKEMALSREELLLWSCLMWEILTKEEAKTYFLNKAVRMDVSQERFDAVLQRLEVRQLVVSAQAEKGDIALYRLLAKLYVIPLESSFMVKVQAFFRFIFFEKLPLTVAKNVFQKENYTEMERRVLHLARKARLSCAEILACIANDEIDTSIGNQSEFQKEKARDNLGFFLWFCDGHRKPNYRDFFTPSRYCRDNKPIRLHNRKTCQRLTFFLLLLLSHRNVSILHKNSPFRLRNRFYRRFRTNAETSHHYPIRQNKNICSSN